MVCAYSQTKPSILAIGKITKLMAKVSSYRRIDRFMKALGTKISCMVRESLLSQMEPVMKENLKIICLMVEVLRFSKINQNIRVLSSMG